MMRSEYNSTFYKMNCEDVEQFDASIPGDNWSVDFYPKVNQKKQAAKEGMTEKNSRIQTLCI